MCEIKMHAAYLDLKAKMIKLITALLEGYYMVIKAHGVPTYRLLKRVNKVLLFSSFFLHFEPISMLLKIN